MMASNLISRLLPSNSQGRSIYESLRAHDDASESDIEEQAGMAIDEENLRFRDDELGDPADVFGDVSVAESTTFLTDQQEPHKQRYDRKGKGKSRSHHLAASPRLLAEEPDDDVPASLLIEGNNHHPDPEIPNRIQAKQVAPPKRAPAIPTPSEQQIREERERAHWEMTQEQQKLHDDGENRANFVSHTPQNISQNTGYYLTGSPKDKAMWRWVNVTNLDNFIVELYAYFEGAGIWCIVLAKVIDILTLVFVAVFTTFLTQCVDYRKIYSGEARSLKQSLVPQCTKNISGLPNLAIWLTCLWVLYRVYQLLTDLPRLIKMRDFYIYLLEIPDSNMQTISFQEVIGRLMALRDANPVTAERISPHNRKFLGTQSKQRLDAHDIANRLMRRENYLIALFNKEILDLTLPIPFLQGRQLFSKILQWNLDLCILDFVFNDYGQVKQLVLKDSHRRELSDALRRRFIFAGWMNLICAPVIIIYVVIVYFFRYFNQYHKNPAALGSRGYTPLAEWKFREFNELHHLFNKRLNMSYPIAKRYLSQFPNVKTAHVAKFVSFMVGAITSVLMIASLWDSEVLAGFDITPERPVLFYIGVFAAIWGITNGMAPEENEVFEPEFILREVIQYTRYMPNHWENQLHSDEVKQEFSTLYQLKLVIFIEEVLSIIITPFLLWFALPKCSDQIIDFFREFTVHVDGVGYVCSFAVFDFKNGVGRGPTQQGRKLKTDVREDYYSTKHGKMAASYYNFLDNYALNPRGVSGHNPSSLRQFHPPPAFPGLMSPSSGADLQSSKMGRSERQRNRTPHATRTPRFAPNTTGAGSPMASILLDPRHQPASDLGTRSIRRNSRSRYQGRRGNNIIEEPMEDEDDLGRPVIKPGKSYNVDDTIANLGESTWEVNPGNGGDVNAGVEEEEEEGGGVLGLLYQFHHAQGNGRVGVGI